MSRISGGRNNKNLEIGGMTPSGPKIAPDPPTPHSFCVLFAILSAFTFRGKSFQPPFSNPGSNNARITCLFRRFCTKKVALPCILLWIQGRSCGQMRLCAFCNFTSENGDIRGAFVPHSCDFVLLGVWAGQIRGSRGAGLVYISIPATRFQENAASWRGKLQILRRGMTGRYGQVGAGEDSPLISEYDL